MKIPEPLKSWILLIVIWCILCFVFGFYAGWNAHRRLGSYYREGFMWVGEIEEGEPYDTIRSSRCGHCGSEWRELQALKSLNLTLWKSYTLLVVNGSLAVAVVPN